MRQVIQNVRTGKTVVAQIPPPLAQAGEVLIQNACSVISAGTEKMVIDLSNLSLLGKARQRPDQVRQVLEKIRTQGLSATWQQVSTKLNEPMPLGYSSAGVVLACGAGVQQFKVGDRVASNGQHAGVVSVPKNLVASVPDNVSLERAAFAVISSIGLQGIRLAEVTLGETVLVIGLGLIGQIVVQLLKLHGARVLATDLDAEKCRLAIQMGADEAIPGLTASAILAKTRGIGADAVVITAATKSNGPIELAADAVRVRGRVVAVGAVGMQLPRQPFYLKEARFVVSCSYGPGRYDPTYEQQGHDYPVGHVRWTEQRNMQAILDLMGSGRLDLTPLITHRYRIDDAEAAYEMIHRGTERYLGILLQYPAPPQERRSEVTIRPAAPIVGKIGVGCLGAGNFAKAVLLPAMSQVDRFRLLTICSGRGLSAATGQQQLGFEQLAADECDVFNHPDVQLVVAVTRHDQHARQVLSAIRCGKPIFVEKPLAITVEELAQIEASLAQSSSPPVVMVGFNRRFSPAAAAVKSFFQHVPGPRTISIRFNAGPLPGTHWTHDEQMGGGRIIGEACHAVDLATYLAGSPVLRVYAESIGGAHAPAVTDDQCFITLRHYDGSVSNVAYLAGGDKSFPKERVEVFGGGRVALIDDFCRAEVWQGGRSRVLWKGHQDKGHAAELNALADALTKGSGPPIPWQDLFATTLATILAVRSLREGWPLEVPATLVEDEQVEETRLAG